MPRIPDQFIRDLIARSDIIDVVGARVELKKKGQNYLGICPFHQEKTPSFTVSPAKQFYHCFGCGEHGNTISFVMRSDNCDFVTAIEKLAHDLGMEVPKAHEDVVQTKKLDSVYALYQSAQAFYRANIIATEAQDYLSARGIDTDTATRFGIGYVPNAWDGLAKHLKVDLNQLTEVQRMSALFNQSGQSRCYDRFRGRLMFPIHDRKGRVVAFGGRSLGDEQPKYLNSAETAIFHKRSQLYGLYEALKIDAQPEYMILVEGYMDVVALAQANINNAVAALGTAVTAAQLQQLFKATQTLVFCLDGDQAGETASWRTLERVLPLLKEGRYVRVVSLPKGEDPDSYVQSHGKNAFLECIETAPELPSYLLDTLSKRFDLTITGGKADFAAESLKLIAHIPAGPYQALVQEQVAQRVGLSVDALSSFVEHRGQSRPARQKSVSVQTQLPSGVNSMLRWASAALLQHPHLITEVDFSQVDLDDQSADHTLLSSIITKLKLRDDYTPAQCLELWRESPEAEQINRLIAQDLLIPINRLVAELNAIFSRLRAGQIDHRIQHLLQCSQENHLTDTQREELLKLLKHKHEHPNRQEIS